MREPLRGDAYWELMKQTAARVDKWPSWKTGEKVERTQMSRNFGAFRNYEQPDVIEDTWEHATRRQLAYIQDLRKSLGRQSDENLLLLSKQEAAAIIHDLHLEWLRERA